jgi:hypothetical protein
MDSRIDDAINEAIQFYMINRFWFNEAITTFNTITDQRQYTVADGLPSDILEIDIAKALVSGGQIILQQRTFQYMENVDRNSFTGNPTICAWYENSLFLYPIPDNVYVVTLDYKKLYLPLTEDDDTNDFTVYASSLIKAKAKWILYMQFLKDPEMAQIEEVCEMKALGQLTTRSEQLSVPNEVIPEPL